MRRPFFPYGPIFFRKSNLPLTITYGQQAVLSGSEFKAASRRAAGSLARRTSRGRSGIVFLLGGSSVAIGERRYAYSRGNVRQASLTGLWQLHHRSIREEIETWSEQLWYEQP